MKEVIAQTLISFGNRVHIEGAHVILNARAAQGFALVTHELATNAAKYGALTTQSGTVSVRWSIEGNSDNPTIKFHWRECGGPPVTPPTRKGFGSKLLEHAVAHAGDPPRLEYAPGGFTYELQAEFAAVTSRKSH
jgi:two-component sensor histidine kinase